MNTSWLSHRLLGWLALGGALSLALVLSCHKIYEADIGFHLRAGERILEQGRWPQTDPFTYTVSDHVYIDMQWLYQVALAVLYRLGGAPALVVAHAVLIVAAFAAAAFVSWQKFPSPLATAALLLLGVLAAELRFMLRPEVLTWLFLSLTILILERHAAPAQDPHSSTSLRSAQTCPERSRRSALWLLPLILLLWVNVEGLFVLGWVVIGCYLLGHLWRERRLDRRLMLWGGASVAATLLNPYFLRGVFFPLTLLTRLSKENVFGQTISEFVSPWQWGLPLPWSTLAYYLLAALTLLGLLLTRRQRHPREFLLAAAFFILSAQLIRNIPLFVIVSLPILAGCLNDLAQRFTNWQRRRPKGAPKRGAAWLDRWRGFPRSGRPGNLLVPLAGLILLVSVGLIPRVLTNAYYIDARRPNRFGFEFSAENLPVKAAAFIRERGLTGRIFNDLIDGGYLIWLIPQPVFIDGRLEVMGEEFYREYQTAYQKDQLLPLLQKYDVEVAIFPYQAAVSWLQQLRAAPQWRLVYYDHLSVIYVRTDVYPDLAEAAFPTSSPNGFPVPVPAGLRDKLLYAPRAGGPGAWLEGFWQTPPLPRETINSGIFYFYLDKWDIAEAYLLDALQTSQGRYIEVYLNLGSVYYNAKRNDLAAFAYQTALAEQPDIPLARERLNQLVSP